MRTYYVPPQLADVKDWPKLALACHYCVRDIADARGVTARQLRSFCKHTLDGATPKQWLRELRLAQAEVFLAAGKSTEEVARLLSYTDAAHFCHEFKRERGRPPQTWSAVRKQLGMPPPTSAVKVPALPPPELFPDERKFPWVLAFGYGEQIG